MDGCTKEGRSEAHESTMGSEAEGSLAPRGVYALECVAGSGGPLRLRLLPRPRPLLSRLLAGGAVQSSAWRV